LRLNDQPGSSLAAGYTLNRSTVFGMTTFEPDPLRCRFRSANVVAIFKIGSFERSACHTFAWLQRPYMIEPDQMSSVSLDDRLLVSKKASLVPPP
jgi:hypothetical protein